MLKRTWRPIIFVALVEAGIGGIYFFGTELIPRDRPPVKLLDAGLVPDASFPSGHVATSLVCWAGTMILVWTYFRAARWVAVAAARAAAAHPASHGSTSAPTTSPTR